MSSDARTRNGNARRKAVARLRAEGRPCWICRAFGRDAAIDYSLPARHPMSFECDELVPVSLGGSPTDPRNLAAAHRRCNEWRSNRSVTWVMGQAEAARGRSVARVEVSRSWL
ncbi:MAG: HNH endonuclease [Olsenella uli]|uniref:HNH endonuclease n=1 Tax=Olsenella uli TaxID=133926 RepID=UPI001DE03DCE|nr:HNH endonuclease [Olsenella uli]MBS6418860.1 HNH endonuclease [Olsenella uli]